ncbi:hypothetical protein PVAP13_5NG062381 [Panicum virgatum]|uniref:CCHC-type domain-containing protein n=1 Tax=Panicum virgatum TaxID=38727 RepID=A0A8T0RN74_PANVG|nr:hypothetical protein PVAP13_5NG062381 [Panicum virgatum]
MASASPPPAPSPTPPLPDADTPTPAVTPTPAATSPLCSPGAPSWRCSGGGAPLRSFKDVLLAALKASTAPACPPSSAPGRADARVVVRPRGSSHPGHRPVPDADGWFSVVSRRKRKELRCLARQPRRVPADLRGRCFNCFSARHRAASYRSGTQCFRCRSTGHRCSDCPERRVVTSSGPRSRLVWRPVSAAPSTTPAPMDQAPTPVAAMTAPGDAPGPSRRRQRSRKRRNTGGPSPSAPPPYPEDPNDYLIGSSSDDASRDAIADGPARPRCVIRRSAAIAQREERLAGCALIVSVIADEPDSLKEHIIPAIARRFKIEETLLSIIDFGHARFLLISPDEFSATRILNDGRPLSIPPGRIHFMRWTRFFQSSAAAFTMPMEVELRGIPTHAWELETVS